MEAGGFEDHDLDRHIALLNEYHDQLATVEQLKRTEQRHRSSQPLRDRITEIDKQIRELQNEKDKLEAEIRDAAEVKRSRKEAERLADTRRQAFDNAISNLLKG
jgi:DNA repair ATPase RecN